MENSQIFDATPQHIELAAKRLRAGSLIGLPTETVYGLAGDARNDQAVAEIYAMKGRPDFNPLIVHGANVAALEAEVEFTPLARKLSQAFWPGPMTLVLKRRADSRLSLLLSAGLDTVAVRVPAHPIAQSMLSASGLLLAAPSANKSGRVSPTCASHVADELPGVMVLDGGSCEIGLESTVINAAGEMPVILRHGFITDEMIEEAVGNVKIADAHSPITSPGMLARHYSPSIPVRLNVMKPEAGEALLAFGPDVPSGAKEVFNLSPGGDTKEAASRLFAAMRRFDRHEFTAIGVMPVPAQGLGIAINDRLKRAASAE